MGILAIALINILVVVGGGELGDKIADKVNKTGEQLNRIEKKAEKKTKINVNVNPVINFKPVINVKPIIKNVNSNTNGTKVSK